MLIFIRLYARASFDFEVFMFFGGSVAAGGGQIEPAGWINPKKLATGIKCRVHIFVDNL